MYYDCISNIFLALNISKYNFFKEKKLVRRKTLGFEGLHQNETFILFLLRLASSQIVRSSGARDQFYRQQ